MLYTDIELVEGLKNRDAKALAHIWKLEKTILVHFAENLVCSKEDAEYIVGDSFMKLWANHSDFESLTAIKSFLYDTTRESCLNFFKYSRKMSEIQTIFAPGPDRNN